MSGSLSKYLILVLLISFSSVFNSSQKVMGQEKVSIEIWSDIVCPFCILGKRKIEQAIVNLNAEDKVEIEWKSFLLNPDFPSNTSVPTIPYLSEHKGYPESQVKAMCNQLTVQGKEYDIDFQFDKSLAFNTLDAHRLIQWAKTKRSSHELKEAYMQAYFTNGVDLSQEVNVLKVVEGVGLNVEEAKNVLHSTDFLKEVQTDIQIANQIGVRGVPFFVLNKKSAISGAQPDEVFEKALIAALQDLQIEMVEGKVCEPGKVCD